LERNSQQNDPPGQVTGLSVSTAVTKWSNTEGRIKVVLTWQKPQGATGFYVDVHDGYTWRAFDVGNVTSWIQALQKYTLQKA